MSAPRTLLAVVTLSAALISGCGGGGGQAPSPQDQAAATVRTFLRALAAGDGEAACGQLTADGQRRIVAVVGDAAQSFGASPAACAEAVGLVRAALPTGLRAAIREARVEGVTVAGDRATARVVDGTAFGPQRVALAQRDGRWRISNVPTLSGG